jgi:hypothetical protein
MDIEKAKIMLQKRRDRRYMWFLKYTKKTDRINNCKRKEFSSEQVLRFIESYRIVLERAHDKYREQLFQSKAHAKDQAKHESAFSGLVEFR